jgi:hypothetical protein
MWAAARPAAAADRRQGAGPVPRAAARPAVVRVLLGAPVVVQRVALLEVEVVVRLALALRPVWAVSDRSLA